MTEGAQNQWSKYERKTGVTMLRIADRHRNKERGAEVNKNLFFVSGECLHYNSSI